MSTNSYRILTACILSLSLPACAPGALAPQSSNELSPPPPAYSLEPTASTAPPTLPATSPSSLPPSPSATAPTMAEATPPAQLIAPVPTSEELATERPVAQVPAGWQTLMVDNWAAIHAPAGWKIQPGEGGASSYLIDNDGKQRVSLYYVRSEGAASPPACNDPAIEEPSFTMLDSTPLGDIAGEELQHSLFIKEVIVYNYETDTPETKYQVVSNISESDRTAGTECAPLPAVYPDSGGYFWVSLQGDPIESLYFDSEIEAAGYTTTEEYEVIKRIIESIQIVL